MIKDIDKIYDNIIENLQLKIVSEYGSVSKFSKENNVCRHNLSKVFNKHQVLSLFLYININEMLNTLCPGRNTAFLSNMTLKEYLGLDHASIIASMFNNIMEG